MQLVYKKKSQVLNDLLVRTSITDKEEEEEQSPGVWGSLLHCLDQIKVHKLCVHKWFVLVTDVTSLMKQVVILLPLLPSSPLLLLHPFSSPSHPLPPSPFPLLLLLPPLSLFTQLPRMRNLLQILLCALRTLPSTQHTKYCTTSKTGYAIQHS